jgi:hypothetical protein
MPAEQLKAVRFTVEENKKRIDWLGEFASANVARVEKVKRAVTELAEGGEKIPIPIPEKLSGEDSSLDIPYWACASSR